MTIGEEWPHPLIKMSAITDTTALKKQSNDSDLFWESTPLPKNWPEQ